jgi:hypothetical protein
MVFLAKNPKVSQYNLSCINVIFSGAAPAGADLCDELNKRHPNLQHIVQGKSSNWMRITNLKISFITEISSQVME